jgi:hypothetical protein
MKTVEKLESGLWRVTAEPGYVLRFDDGSYAYECFVHSEQIANNVEWIPDFDRTNEEGE